MKYGKTCLATWMFSLMMVLALSFTGCATPSEPETTEKTIPETSCATEPSASVPEEEIVGETVPILLYHHITEQVQSGAVSTARFAEQIQTLAQAGYTAVSFQQLMDYVQQGTPLPEKPIVITFDDGYESNLSLAAPILQEYGMSATIFTIGVSIGKDTYKDTGAAMIPHFALEEAKDWSGVIWIESHGYDVHEVVGRDPEPIRQGVLQKEEESEEAYRVFLTADCGKMDALFQETYGRTPEVFAYPYGMFSDLTDEILQEQGIRATVTTRPHLNVLVQGDASSLLRMGRFSISEEVTQEILLYLLEHGAFPEPEPADNPA